MTELDGSLSIDTLKFNDYFKANPADFDAIMQNRVSSGNSLVQASGTGTLYQAGTYDLELTSSDGVSNGLTLNDIIQHLSDNWTISVTGASEAITIDIVDNDRRFDHLICRVSWPALLDESHFALLRPARLVIGFSH